MVANIESRLSISLRIKGKMDWKNVQIELQAIQIAQMHFSTEPIKGDVIVNGLVLTVRE